jgi:gluconate kinase
MKRITIIFGEMGCGKTYWGKRYAAIQNLEFFEGDSVLIPEMVERVQQFKPIPREVIEKYIDVLANAIADKMETCDELVVSQALYLDEDRKALKLFLECQGFEVRMWWLQNKWWRNINNLLTRDNGLKWVYYWLINKPFFQKPTHEHQLAYNIYTD